MQSPNPYTPPSAVLDASAAPSDASIEALAVSPKWKERFIAIAHAGGSKLPNFKQLSRAERQRAMGLNFLAFFFGPIYYAVKGMWKRGLLYLVLGALAIVAAALVLEYFGFGIVARSLHFGLAVFYGMRANIDFYKKTIEGNNGWW